VVFGIWKGGPCIYIQAARGLDILESEPETASLVSVSYTDMHDELILKSLRLSFFRSPRQLIHKPLRLSFFLLSRVKKHIIVQRIYIGYTIPRILNISRAEKPGMYSHT
jgi:hypothetical protein